MNRPARKPIANGNLGNPSAGANVGMSYVTALLYQQRRLLSTEFTFKSGERYPHLSLCGAVSSPGSDVLESSSFLGSSFFYVRRVLASCAGPGGITPFIHLFQALNYLLCLFGRRLGGLLDLVVRLRSAILRSSMVVWRFQPWWRFATWVGAGCVVGSRLLPCGDVTGRREWL